MSQQTVSPTLIINVGNISILYQKGTGSKTEPTLLPNDNNKYYIPIPPISANLGDTIQINCTSTNPEGVPISSAALAYESGEHIGVSKASMEGSIFTINAKVAGTEEFYIIFSFSYKGNEFCCKIDPELKVRQGSGDI